MDAQDWLEDWIENNIVTPLYHDSKEAMKGEADACRAEAQAAGISIAEVTAAAGGDLEAYLLRHQNAMTDAEVKRKADKDD